MVHENDHLCIALFTSVSVFPGEDIIVRLSPCIGTRHEDHAGAPPLAWCQQITGQARGVLSTILLPVLRGLRRPLLSLLLCLHKSRCFMQSESHKLHPENQAASMGLRR